MRFLIDRINRGQMVTSCLPVRQTFHLAILSIHMNLTRIVDFQSRRVGTSSMNRVNDESQPKVTYSWLRSIEVINTVNLERLF